MTAISIESGVQYKGFNYMSAKSDSQIWLSYMFIKVYPVSSNIKLLSLFVINEKYVFVLQEKISFFLLHV